jgi:hypothetical protein
MCGPYTVHIWEATVSYSSDIGFLASALVLTTFGMKDMVSLRIVAICSNIAFIAYALVLSLPPILILHVMLLPLNGWRLTQALQDSPSSDSRLAFVKHKLVWSSR